MSVEFLITTVKELLTSWPFVVLILGLVYRGNLPKLLRFLLEKNLKVKAPGVEFEASDGAVQRVPTLQDKSPEKLS